MPPPGPIELPGAARIVALVGSDLSNAASRERGDEETASETRIAVQKSRILKVARMFSHLSVIIS